MASPTMDLIKPLVTLVAIVNPLAIVPFFILYTQGYDDAQRRRTVRVASFSAFVVIAVSALLGTQLLAFFGISIASFQVGGGLLLLVSSLSMLNAQPAEGKTSAEEVRAAEAKASMGASIAFSLAQPIERVLGKTGINVMTRLMGLILAALAVELMADGLGKPFPVLERAG